MKELTTYNVVILLSSAGVILCLSYMAMIAGDAVCRAVNSYRRYRACRARRDTEPGTL